jgi:TRAP-type C4-dicarboxylate transport system permease small subunit
MVKEWRRDALIYAKLGMGFYIVSCVISSIGLIGFPLFFSKSDVFVRILMTIIGILCSTPPLLLAWLTYNKIVKVLRENHAPSTKWAKALEWLGYFLGLFIAGLMLYIANKKLAYAKLELDLPT